MITIKGIYGREMFETWYAMNADGPDTAWTCRMSSPTAFPPIVWEEAFAIARNGNGGKVVLDWFLKE